MPVTPVGGKTLSVAAGEALIAYTHGPEFIDHRARLEKLRAIRFVKLWTKLPGVPACVL
jgi:hypothetical protein